MGDYSINSNSRPLLEHSEASGSDTDYLVNSTNALEEDHIIVDNDDKSLISRRIAPSDKYNFTYMIFYLLGTTTMVPWNFCLTAEDYWMYKFRNTTTNATDIPLTPIQTTFTSDLSFASALPSTVFLILNAFIGHKIPLSIRMIGSMVLITGLFIVMTAFVEINTDEWQKEFLTITLLIVLAMNIAAAIVGGSLFGIAGQFPSEYVTAVMSGQALGGIFAAISEIISLTFGASPKTTAFVFFNVGNVTLLLSIVCYIIMSKTLFFKFYTFESTVMSKSSNSDALVAQRREEPCFGTILNKIWLYGFTEWFVFVTTLSVYPSVTVLINSENKGNGNPWNDIYFVTVVNYLIFNSGDYLGRILAGLIKRPKNNPVLVAGLAILRVIFVPLLLMCNEHPRHSLPVLIHSDLIVIAIISIFAVSNGYLANIAFMSAPTVVLDHEREMASSMMAAFLGIGLAFGSALSLVFVEVI